MTATSARSTSSVRGKLPLAGLLALFTAGFVSVLTETLPAGLLPQMSSTFGESESLTGQTVTIYAIGSAVSAIPLSTAMTRWGRRNVVIIALMGFILANSATALAPNLGFAFGARFVAGVAAGLIWSNIGGYAARLVPGKMQGRGIAIAMAGTPVALSLGLPAGAFVGTIVDWRLVFGIVTAISVLLIGWVLWKLPNFAGQAIGDRVKLKDAIMLRGMRTILWTLAGFVIAHNLLYTYIGPLVAHAGIGNQLQWVLFTFGVASIISIWIIGTFIDRHHRKLIVASMTVFAFAALAIGLSDGSTVLLYIAVGAWGLTFGGATTLFLTAGSRAAGAAADVAQSMIVTVFNIGIALGGLVGGIFLAGFGVVSIPWLALAIMIPTVASVALSKRHAFPAKF
jgi:predicted MFS family arabinose efflux permease